MSKSSLSNVVRKKFIDYFTIKHGHAFIPSSPVKPELDAGISFVNAGMNQFKHMFLAERSHYEPSRVCNYQKCIRVGGKMCDLATIGHDHRHHTFFEMLGNWSFNSYDREEACEWALDFLVNDLNLSADKMQMTYFRSKSEEDTHTRDIWSKLGLKSEQIVPNDKGDNFWDMGTNGPCGLSTEIFYPNNDDMIEIWNLVFIDRQKSSDGKVSPLKNRFVDTGMGLERILAILEGVSSNYDTDLFKSLFSIIEKKSPNVNKYQGSLENQLDIDYRILVDHCRMISIAIADGIVPGREGAEYMLRSTIKKVILLSRDSFKQDEPRYLIFDLVDEIIVILEEAYPELRKHTKLIRRTLAHESKRYLEYLSRTESAKVC